MSDLQDKILIWGKFQAISGSTIYPNLARLNADGSLDTTFPLLRSWDGAVTTVALQGPGGAPLNGTTDKILVGGL